MDNEELLVEYDNARAHTAALYDDLTEEQVRWRPHADSSGIGWHLGHQAAVTHYLVRNLVAAEPSRQPAFDRLFDSETQEAERGELPALGHIVRYREEVAARTHARVGAVLRGEVGAPTQLALVTRTLLVALIQHEYQHDTWIGEVRAVLGRPRVDPAHTDNLELVDGYWVLARVPVFGPG